MERPTTLESLMAEAQDLRARLEEIETLIRLATKYKLGTGAGTAITSSANPAKQITGAGVLTVLAAQMSGFGTTMKDKIINGSEHVLSDGKRRLSREIVADLAAIGVVVPGDDPAGYLATYLSKEKSRFTSDVKAGGWTLTRIVQKGRPGDVGASSGLFNINN